MKTFFGFMASVWGRAARAAVGLVLIGLGFGLVGGTGAWVMFGIGSFFVLVGILDVCVFAPLFGKPFTGPRLRAWARGGSR